MTNVVKLEGAVTGFLNEYEAEPAAVLLGVSAAVPSAEWPSVRWALERQGVPLELVDARFMMCGPVEAEVYMNGRSRLPFVWQ